MHSRLLKILFINLLLAVALFSIANGFTFFVDASSSDSTATPTGDTTNSVGQRSYSFDEIVVTAIRSPLSRLDSPSRVQQIGAEEIQASSEKNLGELLTGKTGILVRHYGVGGSLQTASFRGMSAEHSVVLLDGIPIGNVQTGLTDLSLISLGNVESIELVRGGSSAQYGSDALGGAINILTHSTSKLPFVRLDASTSSVGAQRLGVTSQLPFSDELNVRLGSAVEYGRGDFAFTIQDGARRVDASRSGSDFRSRHLFVKGSWKPSQQTHTSFMLSSYNVDRGTPGPVLSVANQGTARQSDEQLQASVSLQTQMSEELQLSVAANVQNAYERYVDRFGVFSADNYYRNILTTVQSNLHYSFSPNLVLHPGVEVGQATATGNSLEGDQSRTHAALYLGGEFHSDLVPFRISVYPSLRYDNYSSIGNAVSPKLGLNVRYASDAANSLTTFGLALHSTLGKNFRAPTFNELYYAGSGGRGNLNLNPEHSMSFDAGLTLNYSLLGLQEVDVTYYTITTDDRIQWLPTSVVSIWSPINIGKTQSYGVEVEYRWSPLPEYLSLEGNYSTFDARKRFSAFPNDQSFNKQLIYVPLETGNVALNATLPVSEGIFPKVFVQLEDTYVGQRYIAEDNSEALPSYHTLNGSVRLKLLLFGMTASLKYEMLNLLNESYEILPRYPMPLRNFSFSLSIHKSF